MKNRLFKITLLFLAVSTMMTYATGKTQILSSPDGKTVVTFDLTKGKALYSIKKGGKTLIKPSHLGFQLSKIDSIYSGLALVGTLRSSADNTWQQPWGEELSVRNHYNELIIKLQENYGKHRLLNIVFRAFDDGVGFRYEFPKQKNLSSFEIINELTEFALARNDSAWSIPAYKGEYYEIIWKKNPVNKADTVTTPITIETNDGKYMAIHEANLTDYAKMNLFPVKGTTTLKTDLTPWSTGVKVYAKAPFVSPWRTIIMADRLNDLYNSRLMLNLNEPSKIKDTSWTKPAKYAGIWWGMHMEKYTWSQGSKHGATTENTKAYIDFAASHHLQGVLVEGWNYGWDGDWVTNGDKFSFTKHYPDYDLEELCRYATSKGVQLIGHNETGGAVTNYEHQLDTAFSLYHKLGITYVKTGYVNALLDKKERHGSQYGVRHYRKVIETAARYGIVIDNHEPVMPTGLQRTYPNLMTQEGVRGQEYDAWSRDGGNPPSHTCIVPFTRGLAGPMDFTFGTFNFTNPVYPQTRVQTTIAKQLALYVVIYSPLQMASDLPENYNKQPAFEFIELVPTDWAKTIIVDGKIGEYVITARKDKHSDNWFAGAITNEKPRDIRLKCDFLEKNSKYKVKIFKDSPQSDWKNNPTAITIETIEAKAGDTIDLHLAAGGGSALCFQKL